MHGRRNECFDVGEAKFLGLIETPEGTKKGQLKPLKDPPKTLFSRGKSPPPLLPPQSFPLLTPIPSNVSQTPIKPSPFVVLNNIGSNVKEINIHLVSVTR